MTKTIRTTTEAGETMVWYLSKNGAVVVDLRKNFDGWGAYFRGKRMEGFSNKAQAVSHAKKWLKEAMKAE